MDALNHADQMRLANLINDNSDDAEIQKKLDQVVELTNTSRDQAAVALHDCDYDVEKAVDMILEGDHATVEQQWKSAGKKKGKNNPSSQAAKAGSHSASHHQSINSGGPNKHAGSKGSSYQNANSGGRSAGSNVHTSTSNTGDAGYQRDAANHQQRQRHEHQQQQQHYIDSSRNSNQSTSIGQVSANQFTNNVKHQDPTESLKNLVGITSSNITSPKDLSPSVNAKASMQQPQHQSQHQTQLQAHQSQRQQLPGGPRHVGNRQQRPAKIPDSAVEMPNNELQLSSLNVQFGELDVGDAAAGSDAKGSFQDSESTRLGRQTGPSNYHSQSSQDYKNSRQSTQHMNKQGPRRPYNNNINNQDDRRYYGNSNRGGRQMTGNQRPYQRAGPMNNSNARGNRTIMSRALPNSAIPGSNSNQQTSGFPNSIDTWTNSTAEAATKSSTNDPTIGMANALRVGQWSDVAGNEDWSEEDWDAKVMETKVFTPSSKAVDGPVAGQKNQPLLTDSNVATQINLASKLSESARDNVNQQQNTLNTVAQSQTQQPTQKPLSHMNDIFDASVAKAVLDQQNLAAIKPKTSIGMSQYNKDNTDPKTVLDQQNMGSIKPKTTMSINQYNKEASESLKSLVGISSGKGNVPSVPPGALPLMSQPPYIMGNAYQPAIFPYPYQTTDVHYPVANPTTGRDQNFQSVYSPSDSTKFNRGTDGDAPSITTTQAAPVASPTHNQAFVANALHPGYLHTYAMPQAFNMMPQNLYSAAPIFPHIPQPTNAGSANSVYQKNTAASYQHHTGYYDQLNQLNPLIQDYVKQQNYTGSNMQQQQQQQQQQPTSKSSGMTSELDMTSSANSYNIYGSVNKSQLQQGKPGNYSDTKTYQQPMSNNGAQQFGFNQSAQQQPTSIAGYPLLQTHNLDGSNLGAQNSAQLHSTTQRNSAQVSSSKYYPNWN